MRRNAAAGGLERAPAGRPARGLDQGRGPLRATSVPAVDPAPDEVVGDGLDSVYGSTKNVDAFNLKYEVYNESQVATKYLDPSFTLSLSKGEK